ncbi:MAG: ABC transporter transmembrane domain-containing protein, partial [Oribacterium sp.]
MARQKIRKLNQEDKKTLLRVLRYIRQYRHLVLLSLLLSALSVVLSLYIPVLIGRAVDRIVGRGEVDFRALFGILRLMLFFIFASALSQWLMNHINNIVSYHVVEDIRTKLFSRIQNLPLSYLDSHPAGDTVSRVITDIDQFSQG